MNTDPATAEDRMAAIRARLDAATEGPWIYENDMDIHGYRGEEAHYVTDVVAAADDDPPIGSFTSREDAELAASAPSDLSWLLSELEAAQARADKAVEARSRLEIQLEDGELSDGYHTHNELYEYRLLYNAHAARGWVAAGYPVVKSWRHSDGEECFGGGWFVVAAELPTGQVTNHYKADDWDLFEVPEAETAFAWDGHTPAEAADRLRRALGLGEEGTE